MPRAWGWMVALLLVLPAAAQEHPPGPPDDEAAVDAPKPATDVQRSMCLLLESAARANGLPIAFFARVIWQESRFRADAVGPLTRRGKRALGIAQFMPGTAADRNLLNPFDPIQALPKSAEYLNDLRRELGNLGLAAAGYNAGPRRVREWLEGSGTMPLETRAYVAAITGATVEDWAKAGRDADRKQQAGPACGELMALLKRAPNTFVAALEERVATSALQPWGVVLGSGFSRPRILSAYASLERRHAAILEGRDPNIIESRLLSRGRRPFYQVRIGAETRAGAIDLCNRLRRAGGACMILRNPRA